MTSKTASKKYENYYQNNQFIKQMETRSTGRGQMPGNPMELSDLDSQGMNMNRKIMQGNNKSVMNALQAFGASNGSQDGSISTKNS